MTETTEPTLGTPPTRPDQDPYNPVPADHDPYHQAPAAAGLGAATSPDPAATWQPQAAGPPFGGPPYPPPFAEPRPEGRRRRGAGTIAAVALAAVVGGLAGGGAVALLDNGKTSTVQVSRSSGSAPTAASANGTVEGAAEAISPSTVTLRVTGSSGAGTGSGVIVRSEGYILTNNHVVASAASGGTITVTFNDGRTATAKIVGTDPKTDLAVVKVDRVSGLKAATFANSADVKVGQTVVAVGSPLGLSGTVTEGIVSAVHRATRAGENDDAVLDAVQTDAAINPGNSGGPLVDLAGRVVGINSAIATAGSNNGVPGQQTSQSGNIGIGFAIPADTAANVAEQLINTGKAVHAYLGVQVRDASSNGSSSVTTGAQVVSISSDGAAQAAGLKTGDVVIKVGDRTVTDADELIAAVHSYQPGAKTTFTVIRGGSEQQLTVTLGSDNGR